MNITIKNIKTISTPEIGSLLFLESNRDIPFDIKRLYYIHNVPKNTKRGAFTQKTCGNIISQIFSAGIESCHDEYDGKRIADGAPLF